MAAKKPPAKKKKKGRRLRRSRAFIMVILAGIGAVFILPTILLTAVGMAPTAIAWLVEKTDKRYAAVTVGAMNAAGVLPVLIFLWRQGHTFAVAVDLMLEPLAWLSILGGTAIGLACFKVIPRLILKYMEVRSRVRIGTLNNRQKLLVEEWGAEVAGEDEDGVPLWRPYGEEGDEVLPGDDWEPGVAPKAGQKPAAQKQGSAA